MPSDTRIQRGFFESIDPDPRRGVQAADVGDTSTCQHCGRVVFLPANGKIDDVGDMCRVCWSFICKNCVGKGGYRCDRIEEKLAREEASYHARRSYGF